MNEAARLLRYARRRAGLSQRALAAAAGMPQPSVARIESGRGDPTVTTLARLLRACGCTLEAAPGTGEGIDRSAFGRLRGGPVEARLAGAAADAAGLAAFDRMVPAVTFDPVCLLGVLAEHDVRFVVVGGLAGRAHGSTTVTNDLDVCPERSPENLARLVEALVDLRARLRGVDDDVPFLLDARTLARADSFTFTTRCGDLDVLFAPAGTTGYDDLMRGAGSSDVGGHPVPIVALDDLIRMKRAAARRKDLIEVEVLLALRDEIGGQP